VVPEGSTWKAVILGVTLTAASCVLAVVFARCKELKFLDVFSTILYVATLTVALMGLVRSRNHDVGHQPRRVAGGPHFACGLSKEDENPRRLRWMKAVTGRRSSRRRRTRF
jgi:hypothetical protein